MRPFVTLKSDAKQFNGTCLSPKSFVSTMLPIFKPNSSNKSLLIVPSLMSALISPFDDPNIAAIEFPVEERDASALTSPRLVRMG